MTRSPTFRLAAVASLALIGGCVEPPPPPAPRGPSAPMAVVDGSFLEDYAATYRFRLGQPVSIQPTPDAAAVLFLRSGPRSFERELFEMTMDGGQERSVLKARDLLQGQTEELSPEEKARRERQRLAATGIASFQLSDDGNTLLASLSGRFFILDRTSGKVAPAGPDTGVIDPRLSPDGRRVAYVHGSEVWVVDLASGRERQLTRDAGETVTNGQAEFVAQEEMSRHHGLWWSPDSKRIAYQQTDTAGMERMHVMDPTHPEVPPQAWAYPRPGKANAKVRLGIVAVSGGSTTWIDWDRSRYEYLANVRWERGAPLTVYLQNRRQTEGRLLAVDTDRGTTTTLVVEADEAWIEIDERVPDWLPDGSGFLWVTERRGARQLELRGRDGNLLNVVTQPDLGFRELVGLAGDDEVLVTAATDATRSHLFRVPLDPSRGAPRQVTEADGFHEAYANPSGSLIVIASETLAGKRGWQALAADGKRRAIRSAVLTPELTPRLELTTVGEDPMFHAALIRPGSFDPSLRYPVIVHVYGGPTSQMVLARPSKYLLDQWIAEHGYVVVAFDGRGTPHRGRRWQREVKHDLIDIPLQDQVEALGLLAEKFPELDTQRVGIFGWSFGGYFAAMAVMRRPDVYHVGVAGAPVADWADYDTHYTERYMDLPERNPEGYAAANVLTYVDELDRPLLVIHGTDDDNVYFTHSLKLVDSLYRQGKRFEFLPLTGYTHMVTDPVVTLQLYGRIMEFLGRALAPRPDEPEVAG